MYYTKIKKGGVTMYKYKYYINGLDGSFDEIDFSLFESFCKRPLMHVEKVNNNRLEVRHALICYCTR